MDADFSLIVIVGRRLSLGNRPDGKYFRFLRGSAILFFFGSCVDFGKQLGSKMVLHRFSKGQGELYLAKSIGCKFDISLKLFPESSMIEDVKLF